MLPILAIIDPEDAPHLHRLKTVCSAQIRAASATNQVSGETITKLARSGAYSAVITTSQQLLNIFLGRGEGTLTDYAGSLLYPFPGCDTPLLILPSLAQLITVPSAPHLFTRWLSKITHPQKWAKIPRFTYTVIDQRIPAQEIRTLVDTLLTADILSVDIETTSFIAASGKWIPKITCVGFAGIFFTSTGYKVETICVPMTDRLNYEVIRCLCESQVPKVLQNWKFDATYLLIWNIILRNVYFDTLSLGHARYAELPKNLAFNAAYYLRDVQFWKDDNTLANMAEHYRYNARDAWVTANLFIAQLREFPSYAKENYLSLFSVEPACLLCTFGGLPIDADKLEEEKKAVEAKIAALEAKLRFYLSSPTFNVGSHVQVKKLLNAFDAPKKYDSSDDAHLAKFMLSSPLNAVLGKLIVSIREERKYYSTYLCAKLLDSKLYYTINTAATDTGRLASQSSSFSYISRVKRNGKPEYVNFGTQIQNIPARYKKLVVAPEGWGIFEIDESQAESRCTAYLSEDQKLLATVETSPDFHCTNASLFFGIPFEELFDVKTRKKLNEALRNLAKRVNHGANYNMGPAILATTMGAENLYRAARLLDLPKKWSQLEIAKYLLGCFDRAYPGIRGKWYIEIEEEVRLTGKLTSPLGYTRATFLKPWDKYQGKRALNALVAHGPQNLSVSILNRGFVKIANELVGPDFRILAQIHDSILGMYRLGCEHLVQRAAQLIEVPVTVRGRQLLIPTDISMGKRTWK